VTTTTKSSLEQINDVSRQLLSCIQSISTSLEFSNNNTATNSPEENVEELPENTELPKLVSERQSLIMYLFEHNTAEELNSEAELLQEMLTLDSELIRSSTMTKQETAEQVIKLKKSKKIKKTYQKY
jgi:hypothetical protein